MTRGKRTCKILKEIRQQIADKNDIEYITSECHFQGECKGTCPKCEAEVKYLENELNKRRQLGKVVTVAGISLGMAGVFSACNAPNKDNVINRESENSIENSVDTMPAMMGKSLKDDTLRKITLDLLEGDVITVEGFSIDAERDEYENIVVGEIEPIKGKKDELYIYEGGIASEIFLKYPGGEKALSEFLNKNIEYPKEAQEKEIEGTVYVNFIVEKDGSLSNINILRSCHKLLDDEALRVVKMMPKWKPEQTGGKNSRMRFNLPIVFKLDDKK